MEHFCRHFLSSYIPWSHKHQKKLLHFCKFFILFLLFFVFSFIFLLKEIFIYIPAAVKYWLWPCKSSQLSVVNIWSSVSFFLFTFFSVDKFEYYPHSTFHFFLIFLRFFWDMKKFSTPFWFSLAAAFISNNNNFTFLSTHE
jgi:hypothetical protein